MITCLELQHTVDTFKSLFHLHEESERVLRHALKLVAGDATSNLGDVLKVFNHPKYRTHLLKHCTNKPTIDFWQREYPKWYDTPRFLADNISPIQVP